ncbi:MAG TPA: chloramphenicol phosphotransferase [Chloroflexota bacterium]|nr:chloramphenicol phosphotransferase [Chloroflexota bacterium]
MNLGQIVILNGAPRAGKSSIAAAIQETFEGVWLNLGLDNFKKMTPERYQPGIGLRPGGEAPDLEPIVVLLYRGMYEAIAAHSRLGVNVVADTTHHDWYSVPRGILPQCARIVAGLPALFVGVRCPLEVILDRRRATWGPEMAEGRLPAVQRFQDAVHVPGIYDVELDTSTLSAAECAERVRQRLREGPAPTAFQQLAGMA